MNNTFSNRLPAPAEPRFKIGQDVHLRTGGPDMVVNQYTRNADGNFIVDTIWCGAGRAEERGTYPEVLLEARDIVLTRSKR